MNRPIRCRVGRSSWSTVVKRVTRAMALTGLVTAAATSGCGIFGGGKSAPPGTTGTASTGEERKIRFIAAAELNTCGEGPANALGVRVYQLLGDAAISGAPQAALWENDETELGDELIDRQEFFLDPKQTLEIKLSLKVDARYVAVVGNFCQTEGECWRWIQPVDRLGNDTALEFGETCVAPAR